MGSSCRNVPVGHGCVTGEVWSRRTPLGALGVVAVQGKCSQDMLEPGVGQ